MVDKVGNLRYSAILSAGKRPGPQRPRPFINSRGGEDHSSFPLDMDSESTANQEKQQGRQQEANRFGKSELSTEEIDKEQLCNIIESLNKNSYYLKKGVSFKLKHDTQESVQVIETNSQKVIQVFSLHQLIELWSRLDHNDLEFVHRGSLVNISY